MSDGLVSYVDGEAAVMSDVRTKAHLFRSVRVPQVGRITYRFARALNLFAALFGECFGCCIGAIFNNCSHVRDLGRASDMSGEESGSGPRRLVM